MGGIFSGGSKSLAGAQGRTNEMMQEALRTQDQTAAKANKMLNQSKRYYNPAQAQALFTSGLNRYQNFDNDAEARAQQAYQANYKPILNQVQAQLGNQFAGLGRAGRNNSRGQYAQAVMSNQLADNAGRQLMGIQDQARNQLLRENQALYAPGADLMNRLAGIDAQRAGAWSQFGQNRANTIMGGNSQMNQLAQAQAQMQQQNAAGLGQLFGSGLGLIGGFI